MHAVTRFFVDVVSYLMWQVPLVLLAAFLCLRFRIPAEPTIAIVGLFLAVFLYRALLKAARHYRLERLKGDISETLKKRLPPSHERIQRLEQDWPTSLWGQIKCESHLFALRCLQLGTGLAFVALAVVVVWGATYYIPDESLRWWACAPVLVIMFVAFRFLGHEIGDRANRMAKRQAYERRRQDVSLWLGSEVTPSEAKRIATTIRRTDPLKKCREAFEVFVIGVFFFASVLPFTVVLRDAYRSSFPFSLCYIMLPCYVVLSVFTFVEVMYDKSQAEHDRKRTSELTLHGMEMLGGFPGSFLAQRIFHHKTSKVSYQLVFMMIVIMHVLLWVGYFATPMMQILSQFLLGH